MTTLIRIIFVALLISVTSAQAETDKTWQEPPKEILDVLHAPKLPNVWSSPDGTHLLLADPQLYPPLSDLAGTVHKLAGVRVNPKNNSFMGWNGSSSPRLVRISDGKTMPLNLPDDAAILGVVWTSDGTRFAVTVKFDDRIELWLSDIKGNVAKVNNLKINPLLGSAAYWLPDMKHLLVRAIPDRGPAPKPPAIPAGPQITESTGAGARSTYESRNLLETAHDDLLFEYYMTSQLSIYNVETKSLRQIGKPGIFIAASVSPDGQFLLVKELKKPWSHEVGLRRFAHDVEVWDLKGKKIASIAKLPLADRVPTHGVATGPRSIGWQDTKPHTLVWLEALDGGDPVAEAPYRDKLMVLEAPFKGKPTEHFKAKERIVSMGWFEDQNKLMLYQYHRMERKYAAWIVDLSKKQGEKWFEYGIRDRYNSPGSPVFRLLANGYKVFREKDGAIYFSGPGGTKDGDRPFLDLKSYTSEKTTRLFRSDKDKYQFFIGFTEKDDTFVIRAESSTEVPNYHLATLGKAINAEEGEATREVSFKPITKFTDQAPALRKIEKRIVQYEREDGVKLSFHLHLPPNYKKGQRLPTVVYAYPQEFSAATAGQIRGSANRFMRIWGPSHLFFLLQGYAVLDNTAMPMIGDPETTYDTFVPQLVKDAEAAVKKAVDMGIADPKRIGVIGHSHGGLMVANLLAHSDLFAAGIARSGSYNKTVQPFGFQSERRSLFEARDAYIDLSPTFFADKVNEPVLIIHGDDDSNPGTLTYQSEVFYNAVSGSGGTARLVLLPFEDHGYRSRESVEHVLWEQMRWFDKYVKNKAE